MSAHFEARTDSRRKFPRLFLANRTESLIPMTDLHLLWPDKSVGQILDISESGILVKAMGMIGHVRLGQSFEVRVRFGNQEPRVLPVKVLRMTAQAILLSLDSVTVAGRLKFEQSERATVIASHWRQMNPQILAAQFHDSMWWHSAFDSNIWLWRNEGKRLEKLIVEFESVAFVHDASGSRFLKTPPSFDEVKGYTGPITDPLPNKVEPGHNWTERLQKSLHSPMLPEGLAEDLRSLFPTHSLMKSPNVSL